MLAFGKSLHIACEFERKCQHVLRFLNLGEMFKVTDVEKGQLSDFLAALVAKPDLLFLTIGGMSKIDAVTAEEIDGLTNARIARNYIAHESGKIGAIHDLDAQHIADAMSALRPHVIDLAKGDNIISVWSLALTDELTAPEWMTQTYEARVLNWVFGEPFDGISSWDEWTLIQMAKRPG